MTDIVRIGELDTPAMEHMLRVTLGDQLDPDTDFEAVWEAAKGFSPAFLKSTIRKAQQISIQRTGEIGQQLTTEDLVGSALSYQAHQQYNEEVTQAQNAQGPDVGELLIKEVMAKIGNSVDLESSFTDLLRDRIDGEFEIKERGGETIGVVSR